MPQQSPVRFTMKLSPDVARKLDILKSVSGIKNRNAVLEDLIPIVYAIIQVRATKADQEKAMDEIWGFVELLEPYWKPYKQTMTDA